MFRKSQFFDERSKSIEGNSLTRFLCGRRSVSKRVKRSLPQSTNIWYLVGNDSEWGELRFDFENGTAEIVRPADWDTVKSNVFTKKGSQVQICVQISSGNNFLVGSPLDYLAVYPADTKLTFLGDFTIFSKPFCLQRLCSFGLALRPLLRHFRVYNLERVYRIRRFAAL